MIRRLSVVGDAAGPDACPASNVAMTSYPVAANTVAYNIPRGGVFAGSNLESAPIADASDGMPLRPVGLGEATLVHGHVQKAVAHYAKSTHLPFLTDTGERTWGPLNVGDPIGDRTVPVVFTLLEMVDEEFVRFLQSHVLKEYPLWRILHCEDAGTPGLNLAVYPDAVSAGHRLPWESAAGQLSEWKDEVSKFRELRTGSLRRQLRQVEAVLSEKPCGFWKRKAPMIACAFDNYEGDKTLCTVWAVVRGRARMRKILMRLDCRMAVFMLSKRTGVWGQ